MKYSALFVFAILALFSCKTKETVINIPETEYRDLDTLMVTAPPILPNGMVEENFELPRYNPSATREHDLIHTKLDLKFDWAKEQVIGKATLTLKPYFYETNQLSLDAKNFKFNSINFVGKSQPLKYDYDGKKLVIDLGRKYKKEETYNIEIDYIASPTAQGGSDAITSDKGLFFINSSGEDTEKPQQIWTQGETENNSRWFPTIDKPNERTTQETYLTVQDKFKTLCNGVLVSSKKNSDGTRTDYWKMDKPHAPYLFAVVVGDYAVVEDSWNGMLVDYYVEPEYKEYARDIFPYTTEMLTLFSEKLGVKYPWQKYSQVVVRDYVSGAMENTTAVIFGEFMQGTKQELTDNLTNEKIVAHELFHHWFGDLVTTESWANLTMNEGFANYSEYMWLEHKYGADEADFHRLNELNGYLSSARNGIHDLIDFNYEDKENMFDAHSYNKGGLVLHMLRNYVGDDAFYAALNLYLTRNEYTDVEAHELRLAFEDVVGEDLNWFFNQWYFDKGQPVLNINYDYDETAKKVMVSVEQTQDPNEMPAIFQLPVAIDIYDKNGKATRQEVMVNERKQTFEFDAAAKPALVNFDAEKVVLGIIDENKTETEYIFQYNNAPKFLDRFEALDALARNSSELSKSVFKNALNDKFYVIRAMAIANVDVADTEASKLVAQLAKTDPKSQVRGEALDKLAETGDKKYVEVAKYIIDNDKAYSVVGAALEMLNELDSEAALVYAKKLENEKSGAILNAVGEIYISKNDPKYMSFFENKWDEVDGFAAISFVDNYAKLASNENVETIVNAAKKLKDVAMNMGQSPWRRFAATKAINDLHSEIYARATDMTDATAQSDLRTKDSVLIQIIEDIKSTEENGQLQQFYANFPNPPAKP